MPPPCPAGPLGRRGFFVAIPGPPGWLWAGPWAGPVRWGEPETGESKRGALTQNHPAPLAPYWPHGHPSPAQLPCRPLCPPCVHPVSTPLVGQGTPQWYQGVSVLAYLCVVQLRKAWTGLPPPPPAVRPAGLPHRGGRRRHRSMRKPLAFFRPKPPQIFGPKTPSGFSAKKVSFPRFICAYLYSPGFPIVELRREISIQGWIY
jgi:hypothetical protein